MNKKALDLYQLLPSVDQILKELQAELASFGHDQVVATARAEKDGRATSLGGMAFKAIEMLLKCLVGSTPTSSANTNFKSINSIIFLILANN